MPQTQVPGLPGHGPTRPVADAVASARRPPRHRLDTRTATQQAPSMVRPRLAGRFHHHRPDQTLIHFFFWTAASCQVRAPMCKSHTLGTLVGTQVGMYVPMSSSRAGSWPAIVQDHAAAPTSVVDTRPLDAPLHGTDSTD